MWAARIHVFTTTQMPHSSPHTNLRLIAALTVLFIALRCLFISADAPLRMFGRDTRELFAEPPAKSHEARNWAVFGAWKLSPADNYQFWRAQSPAWVYPLAGFFRVFGTDYPQLRIFSTLYAALGFVLLLAIASQLMRPSTVAFLGLALALDPIYFHTSRVGFIEPAVATWVTLVVLALLLAERDLRWLVVAHLACALAVFSKQAGIFCTPLVAFGTLYLAWRADRSTPESRRKLWIAGTSGLIVFVASAIYMSSSEYVRAIAYNYGHVVLGDQSPAQNRYRGLRSLLFRLYDPERFLHYFSSLPATGIIAIGASIYVVVRTIRTRKLPSYTELIVFGWFASALFAMEVIAQSRYRFWTIVIPAAAVVAGFGIEWARVWLEARKPSLAALPLAVPLVVLLGWSAFGHIKYASSAEYTVRDGAREIEQQLGERDATIVGFASPGIVLGTPYKNFYVRGGFNETREQLQALGITHFLFRRDMSDRTREIVGRAFPDFMAGLRPDLALQVRAEPLELYDAGQSLGARASVK